MGWRLDRGVPGFQFTVARSSTPTRKCMYKIVLNKTGTTWSARIVFYSGGAPVRTVCTVPDWHNDDIKLLTDIAEDLNKSLT